MIPTLFEKIKIFFPSQYLKNGMSGNNQTWHGIASSSKVSSYRKRMISDQKCSLYWRFFANWERVRIPRPPSIMISKLQYIIVYWYMWSYNKGRSLQIWGTWISKNHPHVGKAFSIDRHDSIGYMSLQFTSRTSTRVRSVGNRQVLNLDTCWYIF